MQLFALTDHEPGMFAIAKRLWQGIKAQHITVKGAAFLEVSYINGDMIKNRLLCQLLLLHCFGFSHSKVVHETADPFEMIEASDGGDGLRTRLAHLQPHPALVVASLDGQCI